MSSAKIKLLFYANCSLATLKKINLFYTIMVGNLKDSNAAAHSVDSDIFYALTIPPARSKTYMNTYSVLKAL